MNETNRLRQQVEQLDREVHAGREHLQEVSERAERLQRRVDPKSLAAARLRAIFLTAGYVVMTLVGLVVYEYVLKPTSNFDSIAEELCELEIKGLERDLEKANAALGPARVRHFARYPNSLGEAKGRVAYPRIAPMLYSDGVDPTLDDVALRWANIGWAACMVGEEKLALFSARVLLLLSAQRQLVPKGSIPITANRVEQTRRVRKFLYTECKKKGTDLHSPRSGGTKGAGGARRGRRPRERSP